MSAQYTPGPWAVTTVGSCHGIHPAASDNERDDICRVVPHNYHPDGWQAAKGEAEANARLIAAAPELLAALQDMVGAYQRHFDVMPVAWQTYDDIARAAIAKATGAE